MKKKSKIKEKLAEKMKCEAKLKVFEIDLYGLQGSPQKLQLLFSRANVVMCGIDIYYARGSGVMFPQKIFGK